MKRLLVALTVAMILLPVTAWSIGTNLDFEGGFQSDGVANDWTQYGGAVNSASDTVFHGGAWSQKCDSTAAAGGVRQTIPTLAGKKYHIKAWAKCEAGGTAVFSPDGGVTLASTSSTEWMEFNVTWPAVGLATGPTTLQLESTGGVVYFDDISVTDITKVGIPDPDGTTPIKLWWEEVNPGGIGGNPFTCGGVFDGNVILGQISNCVRMYGRQKINGTALVHKTPDDIGNAESTAKGATIIGGYIYAVTGYGDFQQSTNWGTLGPIIPFNNNAFTRRKLNNDAAACATDGTHLYAYDVTGPSNAGTSTIYKWAVNHASGGSITPAPNFPVTITGYSRISGIGYWNGKIYAAEAFNGGQIFEIDTTTGAVTNLLSAPNLVPDTGGNYGQVARYGDKIFLATHNGSLITWQLIGGTWTIVSADDLALFNTPNAYGLAVTGDGVNAQNAWVVSGGIVHYYQVAPYNLGDVDFSTGAPTWASGVVTAIGGPAAPGFWIEDQGRTKGAWIPSTETPTVGNLVSVRGTPSKSASGERILTPSEPIMHGAAANPEITPLLMTNKSLGNAAGGIGPATDGMLVTIVGRVTGFLEDQEALPFFIDDGSGVPTGIESPSVGVKVTIANGDPCWIVENFWDLVYTGTPCTAVVTGIVRLDVVGGSIVPRIDARSAADIVLTAL